KAVSNCEGLRADELLSHSPGAVACAGNGCLASPGWSKGYCAPGRRRRDESQRRAPIPASLGRQRYGMICRCWEGSIMTKRKLFAIFAAVLGISFATSAGAEQILKVGSTPTGIPFTFLDTKTNTIQGVMVDLITEIGKVAGCRVEVEPMQFSTLI